jgi:hypothetical protein
MVVNESLCTLTFYLSGPFPPSPLSLSISPSTTTTPWPARDAQVYD